MQGFLHNRASTEGKDHISGSGVSEEAESLYFPVQLEVDIGTRWEITNLLLSFSNNNTKIYEELTVPHAVNALIYSK